MTPQNESALDDSVAGKIQVGLEKENCYVEATQAFKELLDSEMGPDDFKDTIFYVFQFFYFAHIEGGSMFMESPNFDMVCTNLSKLYEFADKLKLQKGDKQNPL